MNPTKSPTLLSSAIPTKGPSPWPSVKPTVLPTIPLSSTPTSAPSKSGILITAPGEGYGHHGNCESFNLCGDAATCALHACYSQGYSTLVSYGASGPCTDFAVCNLFEYILGDTCGLDYDWGNDCGVHVVTDIKCANPGGPCDL